MNRVTPGDLGNQFSLSPVDSPSRSDDTRILRGFCGYLGGTDPPLVAGFEDGYELLNYLEARGWSAVPEKGDWPHVVYMRWHTADEAAVLEYSEGDLTVRIVNSNTQVDRYLSMLP